MINSTKYIGRRYEFIKSNGEHSNSIAKVIGVGDQCWFVNIGSGWTTYKVTSKNLGNQIL